MWKLILGLLSGFTFLESFDAVIYPKDRSSLIKDGAKYDFIVAGAGASGCVVAARLSELGASVLLLEAGGDPDIRSDVPSLSSSLLASNVDWNYKTEPNGKSCLASQGKQCPFSRGKLLGGSTSINYMMYVRGNRRSYDNWNTTGWAWKDIEPYFLKFENLKSLKQLPASSAPYHSISGPVEVEFFDDSKNEWHQRIIDGFQSLNFPRNYDVNAKSQIGVSQVIGYVNNGIRESTARAYLSPAAKRSNLHVAKNARVVGVILDDLNKTALGVRAVLQGNRKVNIYATKEVILSAGAIGTPQILMLSGIGPSEHLQEVGIPVRVDLAAVGDRLADHVLPLLILKVNRGFGVNFPNLIPFIKDGASLVEWLVTRNGPSASNGLSDITAFVNAACYDFENNTIKNDLSEECEQPNLQYIHAYIDRNVLQTVKKIFAKTTNLNARTVNQITQANINHAFIVVSPVLLNPESRGWIKLYSSNPLAPPKIFANYLDSQKDISMLVKAIRIVQHLIKTDIFKSNGASLLNLSFDECDKKQKDSNEYWECYIRQMTHSVFHGMSTTAMGRVVDEELRVYGVTRLRVADGGVMPSLPLGNTAAGCIAIGEKAADLISKTYHL